MKFFNINTKDVIIENCVKENLNNIIKELYKRFIIPFYIPTLMLTILFLILGNISFKHLMLYSESDKIKLAFS